MPQSHAVLRWLSAGGDFDSRYGLSQSSLGLVRQHSDVLTAHRRGTARVLARRESYRPAMVADGGPIEDLADERRAEPSFVLGEREMLEAWLEFHRTTLLLKCEGLTDAQRK